MPVLLICALGFLASALASPVGDGYWIAGKCAERVNADRHTAEYCSVERKEWNSSSGWPVSDVDLCIATCLLRSEVN